MDFFGKFLKSVDGGDDACYAMRFLRYGARSAWVARGHRVWRCHDCGGGGWFLGVRIVSLLFHEWKNYPSYCAEMQRIISVCQRHCNGRGTGRNPSCRCRDLAVATGMRVQYFDRKLLRLRNHRTDPTPSSSVPCHPFRYPHPNCLQGCFRGKCGCKAVITLLLCLRALVLKLQGLMSHFQTKYHLIPYYNCLNRVDSLDARPMIRSL